MQLIILMQKNLATPISYSYTPVRVQYLSYYPSPSVIKLVATCFGGFSSWCVLLGDLENVYDVSYWAGTG